MRLSADRLTAARILMRVEGGAFASRLLSGGGSPAARVRVLEVLRTVGALDAVLQESCRRDLDTLDAEVRAALRIGLAEVMTLDVPPALATDGAVWLVRRLGRSSAAGMVNAVLRKAAAGWHEVLAGAEVYVRLSHPQWLHRRWAERFGERAAASAMAAAQEAAVTWVWFRDEEARRRLLDRDVELDAHPWCPGAWRTHGEVARLIECVGSGTAYAQDPSSQLVAHVAASLTNRRGRAVDLCAAPGGKTALMHEIGAWEVVVAVDLRLNRARVMRPLLEGLGGCVVIAADAAAAPLADGGWDLVLLDAPCSGTGTFRRHPELKWRLRPESIEELAETQRRLLASGLRLVAPGGALLYATCSVEAEENEGVIAELPRGFDIQDPIGHLPAGVPWVPTAAGGIRILPNPDGDGFTMHAIRRKSGSSRDA